MSASYRKWLKDKLEKLQAIDCYSAGASPETIAKQLLKRLIYGCTLRMNKPSYERNLACTLVPQKNALLSATQATN